MRGLWKLPDRIGRTGVLGRRVFSGCLLRTRIAGWYLVGLPEQTPYQRFRLGRKSCLGRLPTMRRELILQEYLARDPGYGGLPRISCRTA